MALVYAFPPNPAATRRRRPPPAPPRPKLPASSTAAEKKSGTDELPLKAFVTTYRGCMLVVTCVAILAVDFRLFPRRFAKVETWGTSLMDMGVGSFVWSAGLVGARPVLRERAAAGVEGRTTKSLARRLRTSLRHSLPLFALGFARLVSVKGVDYAEHVTEYGVHWNFFFTLGLLPPFVALFQTALRIVPSFAALSLLLAGAYELVLDSTPLKAWVLTAPRTGGLLAMNREGICSFAGYLAIFLAGQDAGMFVLPRKIGGVGGSAAKQRNRLLMTMAAWAAIWTLLYLGATGYGFGRLGLTVSRRLANLPYVLWVSAFNSCQLLAFCLLDAVFFPASYSSTAEASPQVEREAYEFATSRVLRAFNRNGLAIFLLANLLTGLVNLTVPTLDVPPAAAMAILVSYSALLTAVAVALDYFDVSVKL